MNAHVGGINSEISEKCRKFLDGYSSLLSKVLCDIPHIQLLEYAIPPAAAAAAVSPKSPRCYGVACVMVLTVVMVLTCVMVLAMLWC